MTEAVPTFCTVTEGELRSLIEQYDWGERRRVQTYYLLDYFDSVPIETPGVYAAYAAIDQYSRRRGIRMGKKISGLRLSPA